VTTPGVLVSINASGGGVPKLPRHRAAVTAGGVEGDRHRNLRVHGGPDRAVCLYSYEQLRALQDEGHQVSVGLLGENLTVMGLDWRLCTPGTRIQVGDVRLLLTAYAVPCTNVSPYFDAGKIFRISQKVHPGWSRVYARVERPGTVQIGDRVTLVQHEAAPPEEPAARLTVRRTGSLRVAAPLAQAFPFFTPDGERLWVPGFDPQYLHPLSGEQGAGAIFTTAHGGEDTLWMILRFSPSEGTATYARVTPGSRGGTVDVALEPVDAHTTQATISYDLTSTSEAGDEKLAALTDAAYAAMLADWEQKIDQALRHDSFD
jgi:MOSC domain-containing protein YiiM